MATQTDQPATGLDLVTRPEHGTRITRTVGGYFNRLTPARSAPV